MVSITSFPLWWMSFFAAAVSAADICGGASVMAKVNYDEKKPEAFELQEIEDALEQVRGRKTHLEENLRDTTALVDRFSQELTAWKEQTDIPMGEEDYKADILQSLNTVFAFEGQDEAKKKLELTGLSGQALAQKVCCTADGECTWRDKFEGMDDVMDDVMEAMSKSSGVDVWGVENAVFEGVPVQYGKLFDGRYNTEENSKLRVSTSNVDLEKACHEAIGDYSDYCSDLCNRNLQQAVWTKVNDHNDKVPAGDEGTNMGQRSKDAITKDIERNKELQKAAQDALNSCEQALPQFETFSQEFSTSIQSLKALGEEVIGITSGFAKQKSLLRRLERNLSRKRDDEAKAKEIFADAVEFEQMIHKAYMQWVESEAKCRQDIKETQQLLEETQARIDRSQAALKAIDGFKSSFAVALIGVETFYDETLREPLRKIGMGVSPKDRRARFKEVKDTAGWKAFGDSLGQVKEHCEKMQAKDFDARLSQAGVFPEDGIHFPKEEIGTQMVKVDGGGKKEGEEPPSKVSDICTGVDWAKAENGVASMTLDAQFRVKNKLFAVDKMAQPFPENKKEGEVIEGVTQAIKHFGDGRYYADIKSYLEDWKPQGAMSELVSNLEFVIAQAEQALKELEEKLKEFKAELEATIQAVEQYKAMWEEAVQEKKVAKEKLDEIQKIIKELETEKAEMIDEKARQEKMIVQLEEDAVKLKAAMTTKIATAKESFLALAPIAHRILMGHTMHPLD